MYVPLERLDLIQKYSSTEGAKPQLDKLGGTTWIARKTRAKRAIRDMAQELLKLYAERKVRDGYAFSPDTEWQKEFEEAFQYDETPDQLTAIADIKRDMESPTADGPPGLRRRRIRQDRSGDARGIQGGRRRQSRWRF